MIGQLDRPSRNEPADISSLYVRNRNGDLIQLDNLVSMEENSEPPTRYHFNRFKSATFLLPWQRAIPWAKGLMKCKKIAKKVLDDSFQTSLRAIKRLC